jgi:hypothetical protein
VKAKDAQIGKLEADLLKRSEQLRRSEADIRHHERQASEVKLRAREERDQRRSAVTTATQAQDTIRRYIGSSAGLCARVCLRGRGSGVDQLIRTSPSVADAQRVFFRGGGSGSSSTVSLTWRWPSARTHRLERELSGLRRQVLARREDDSPDDDELSRQLEETLLAQTAASIRDGFARKRLERQRHKRRRDRDGEHGADGGGGGGAHNKRQRRAAASDVLVPATVSQVVDSLS